MSSHRSWIFGTCLRSSSVSRWIGLRAMTPEADRGRPNRHPLSDQHLRIPAADGLDVDEAVVVDVLDDQADLVGAMSGQHDAERLAGVFHRHHVAVKIGFHVVGEAADILPYDVLNGPSKPDGLSMPGFV